MIRPFTLVALLLACSSGAWMFVVKHRAEAIEQQLGNVSGQIRSAERQIRVLKAQWALQTDPNRLAWLAQIFMPELRPMAPAQLVSWKELAARLPPPGSGPPALPLPPPLPPGLAAQSGDTPGTVPQAVPSTGAPTAGAPVADRQEQTPRMRAAALKTSRPARQHDTASHRAHATRQVVAAHRAHHAQPAQHTPSHPAHHAPIGASVLAVRAAPLPPPRATSQSTSPSPRQPARPSQTATQRTPIREASANPAPAHHRTASSSSVFGSFGANLPPPKPIGNTPQ